MYLKVSNRIDLQIEIVPVPFEKISDAREGEPSAAIRERVIASSKIQESRYANVPLPTLRQANRYSRTT